MIFAFLEYLISITPYQSIPLFLPEIKQAFWLLKKMNTEKRDCFSSIFDFPHFLTPTALSRAGKINNFQGAEIYIT